MSSACLFDGETIEKMPDPGSVMLADPTADANCPLMQEILRRGHPIHLMRGLGDAWHCVRTQRIEYALLELRFGKLTSFRLIEKISKINPSCRIVVYSSYCNIDTAVRATKAGADDVLPKPLNAGFVTGILLGRGLEELDGEGALEAAGQVRRNYILSIYSGSNFNVSKTARKLSMDRRNLQRYLERNQLFHRKWGLVT